MVDLKFFCGFSMAEIANLQGTSERTVQRQWKRPACCFTVRCKHLDPDVPGGMWAPIAIWILTTHRDPPDDHPQPDRIRPR